MSLKYFDTNKLFFMDILSYKQGGHIMKGIILAAGLGTRLYPITKSVYKPLLPVYDKPLIYYGLATLISANIKDIMIIVPPGAISVFEKALGDGCNLGINISYKEQLVPKGIADAFIVAEEFIGNDDVCLMLGDNIFYADDLTEKLKIARASEKGAVVFGYRVEDPRPFGVVEFDSAYNVISIEEKPKFPKSNYIIPGLYFYDNNVVEIAKNLQPSQRGELEITDVNLEYLNCNELQVVLLSEETLWLDAGSADSLLESSWKIANLQKEKNLLVGSPEIAAYIQGYIKKEKLHFLGDGLKNTAYGQYLLNFR